jgi:hypothetical protein
MAPVFSTKAPNAPPKTSDEYNDPKQFLPKRSKLAPGRRLLHLGLLAAIAMADSVSNIGLQTNKTFKRGIHRHRGSHGFLMTSNLKSESIEQLRVILEASKVHLLCKTTTSSWLWIPDVQKSVPAMTDFIGPKGPAIGAGLFGPSIPF